MANVLPRDKQVTAISALCEGNSIRSVERMTGVHRDTIMRLAVRIGQGCEKLMDERFRDLDCKRIEMDEIWAFVQKKQRQVTGLDSPEVGDAWCYVGIDADSKLVPSFLVGKRNYATTRAFVADLASRLRNRVQLSSDGLSLYVAAVEDAFGADVDYGQIVKSYEAEAGPTGRYSPPRVTDVVTTVITGNPALDLISTSYVERQNLTMRMCIRRMTRLTNAFSKKLENHKAALALHFGYYNFVRRHQTIRCTPAMAAGVESTMWTVGDLVDAAGAAK